MVLESIAIGAAGKLAADLVKRLGKKLKTPPIEKAFEKAVSAFAKDFSFEKTENEGILRNFFDNENIRKELINFTGFFGGMPDVKALRKEFVKAGFIEDQMPAFNFNQGILRFVETFQEISSQTPELQSSLQRKLQEKILEELRKLTKGIPPHISDLEAETNYLKQIRSQNRYMDSRGIAQMKNIVQLELDQIFVPLKAKKEVPRSDTVRREKLEKRRREESEVKKEEYEFLIERTEKREEPALRIDDILTTQQNFVILGDPGSGKTTLLKHLAFRCASEGPGKDITDGKTFLPIFLPLRQYSAALSKGPGRAFRKYLPVFFEDNESPLDDDLLEKKLRNGQCLLLFDGLDEVFDTSKRHEVVNAIANFLNRYSNNRFILTSRIAGYSAAPMVGGFPHYTLEDFGSDEIEQFVHKWCWAMENVDQKEGPSSKNAEKNANELFDDMKQNDRVFKLASNPLMCTIIGLIHHQGQKLPNRRIELYNICADTFIFSWELLKREKSETYYDFDERDVKTVLEHVALWMHRNTEDNLIKSHILEEKVIECLMNTMGKTRIEAEKQADAFLQLVKLRTGILLEKGKKLYGFMHLTFQEYFAACALSKERKAFISEIGEYARKPRWKEVILLAAARLGEYSPEDSTNLVRAILDADDEYEQYLHRNLLLAGLCLADDVMLHFDLQKEILDELTYWFKETGIPALRRRIAMVLGSMVRTRGEPESLNILLSGLTDKDWDVRRSALEGLAKFGVKHKQVVDNMICKLEDENGYVRSSAISALGSFGVRDRKTVDKIVGLLEDKYGAVRSSAIGALGLLGVKDDEVVNKIIRRLKDGDEAVRSSAASALTLLGVEEKVVDRIIQRLQDEVWYERSSALRALESFGVKAEMVVDKVVKMLEDEHEEVRSSAVRTLDSLGVKNKGVVDKIVGMLEDEHGDVRSSAVRALGSLGAKDRKVLEKIIQKLEDVNLFVSTSAVIALGLLGVRDKDVVDKITQGLHHENWSVRSSAIDTLGSLGVKDKEVLNKMMQRLEDEDMFVRDSVIRALGSLGVKKEEAVDKIIQKLEDEDEYVRSSAYEALEKLTAE